MHETIGGRVLKARRKAGLYQYQLAQAARTTQSTIAKIESDKGHCHFFIMVEVARALGVSLDWLAYGDRHEKIAA